MKLDRYAVETSKNAQNWRRYAAYPYLDSARFTADEVRNSKPALWLRIRDLRTGEVIVAPE